jgi:RNA polymerase sigma factor (TIGR02999 family)
MLRQWCAGDRNCEAELFAQIYPVIRALVYRQVAGRSDLTLQATELAHEAFLRISEQHNVQWESRGHFFAVAATLVRRVFLDYLRQRQAEKRGSEFDKVSLTQVDEEAVWRLEHSEQWVLMAQLLEQLEVFNPEGLRILEMRVFLAMPMPEIASTLGASLSTVERRWRVTRAWVSQMLALDAGQSGV